MRLGAGLGTPAPYFEVGKHKKMGFGLGWDSGRAGDRGFGPKIGYDITDDIILPKLLKLATLPLKIAHPHLLAPPYHEGSKHLPSFC